jgi:hypothetical protein
VCVSSHHEHVFAGGKINGISVSEKHSACAKTSETWGILFTEKKPNKEKKRTLG